MRIENIARIAAPIDVVWRLVADDFTSIATWSRAVVTSEVLLTSDASVGAPVGGRYCTFADDPDGFGARETITHYDAGAHVLEFDVLPVNAPSAIPLKKNHVRVELRSLSARETELTWITSPSLKPHGYVLFPLLKVGLKKQFRGLLDELKAFAEAEVSGGARASAHQAA